MRGGPAETWSRPTPAPWSSHCLEQGQPPGAMTGIWTPRKKYMEKGEESLFPMLRTAELGERQPGAAYSMVLSCRVVKSHLSLPSILFHLDSIMPVCGVSIARSPLPVPRRRQSQALPHTNHPLGQLFWQIPTKGTAWVGHHGSALATD